MSTPLSVVLITLNAAGQLAECLASVAFADEVVVVDSGSTDGTAALAERYGARVVAAKEWLGYGRQKQFAVEQAANDWVLCLDADERVSRELAASLVRALEAPAAPVYRMARRNRFLGRWLRHGEGYPDWSARLFDRRQARWSDDAVHEKVLYAATPGTLEGDLLHESAEDLARYLDKQNRYTTLAAEELHRRGRRAGMSELLLSPLARFLKFYLLRLGFLDGLPGLAHIVIGCMNSFMKYAKLIELQKKPVTDDRPVTETGIDLRAQDLAAFHDGRHAIAGWAQGGAAVGRDGLWQAIEDNHRCNCLLWDEEDLARRKNVPDSAIAGNKRAIDAHNQKRNDAIERIDEQLLTLCSNIRTSEHARLNSETPGAMIDRLSILSLKIHHMRLQTLRTGVAGAHIDNCLAKLKLLNEQRADLASSLDRLLAEVARGEACFKVYRQFKMYNDPALNPAVYGEKR